MNPTNETLDLLKTAQANPTEVLKGYTQGTGLVSYDLQGPSLKLYPVLTPLRNIIPRVASNGGTATNWKVITGINTGGTSAGVSEGNRGAIIATNVVNKVAAYKGIGQEDFVTFEAEYAGQGFEDIKATAAQGLLNSVMISEERIILEGNTSVQLGQTPTPTLTANATGGSLSNVAYSVAVVALTPQGLRRASVLNGVPTLITKTNADGSTDTFGGGSAIISAVATVTPAANGTITAAVAPVRGAVGYAWYWGTGGNAVLGAVTQVAATIITGAAAGTQTAASMGSSDNSTNALIFDGIMTQVFDPTSGGYYRALPNTAPGGGSTLTSDGAAGIVEIDAALRDRWDNYKLAFDTMWVSAQQLTDMSSKIIASGGAPLFQFIEQGGGNVITGGVVIGNYLAKIVGKKIKIVVHPDLPGGTIVFTSNTIPYKLADIGNLLQVKTRKDYYQLEWPLRTRRYEYGVYADELLQNYFPPAFGVLTNIAAG